MKHALDKIKEARAFVESKVKNFPKMVVVLGSGLGGTVSEFQEEVSIPYAEIPHFPTSTVPGHQGKLVIANKLGKRVAFMQGRVHFFEGYSMPEVVFPVRLWAQLGAENFVLTNASGGLNPNHLPPYLMLIEDHINLMGTNPLLGENLSALGDRFPDCSHVYDSDMIQYLQQIYRKQNRELFKGIYIGLHGPSFETPAEIRMYQKIGADMVGMSTVPEAIALAHMRKKVIGISCVANLAAGLTKSSLNHEEVLEGGKKIQKEMGDLLAMILEKWS